GPLWPRSTLHFLAGAILSCNSRLSGASRSVSDGAVTTVTRGAVATAAAMGSGDGLGLSGVREEAGIGVRPASLGGTEPKPALDPDASGNGVGVMLPVAAPWIFN